MKERISFALRVSKDSGLTCITCKGKGVDREFTVRGDGFTSTSGVHLQCIARAESYRARRRPKGEVW